MPVLSRRQSLPPSPAARRTWLCATLVCLLLVGGVPAASEAEVPDTVDFNRDIKPILSDRCFVCHGPDAGRREADLRLDLEKSAKEVAIVEGRPERSELIRRVTSPDADERMPPASSKLTLDDAEIETIRRWIEQGAPWRGHWAFEPPARVAPPPADDRGWSLDELDRFVASRLEREGLRPLPAADKETLIRRLSFDLIGLPPSVEEIDAFLADSSPDAYERLVDRLLESERFGERMAADWLDVARYSDTYGYQVDRDRFVWPWRDWVIRAFNGNMSFDRFLTRQIAGDLLPDASDDDILATTFNRLHPQKVEGGSVPEEFRMEYVADRTQTVATAFLGLTMECCRCHDHKYDPFTQKEYYQLSSFFDNIDEAGLYSYFTPAIPTPGLLLTDERTKRRIGEVEREIAAAEEALAAVRSTREEALDEWLARRPADSNQPVPGQVARLDFEDEAKGENRSAPGRVGQAVRLSGDDEIGLSVGNFRRFEPFSVALWMNTPDRKERAVVFHRSRAWTDAGSRGYQLLIEEGRLSASLIHFWPGNAMRVRTEDEIPVNEWIHVVMTYDGSSRAAGLRIYVDGRESSREVVRDNLYKNITGGGGDNISIGARFRDRGFTEGLVDRFQVFDRELTGIEALQLFDGAGLVSLLRIEPGKLTGEQREALMSYYLANHDEVFRERRRALREARARRSELVDGLTEIMVMREMTPRRPSYVLRRGAYDAPGERVLPGTPSSLPPLPDDSPRNRLGLARWMTDPEHPLTSRVAVNHYWQMIFGAGLVTTPEDFGSQGRPPTHPELLDWLARDFVSGGWDVKRLLKRMVMSATYRQLSEPPADDAALRADFVARRAKDPDNRLLSRAARYRLPAEMLRDNALAVSGLLVDRVGGSPARPYEVEASFKPVGRDKGEGLYRRSLYTYWKRTGPAPVMMTLDAAKRDVCQVRRERTSSPLQAFVLLNGPQFVEAARVLSQRLIREHGDDTDSLLVEMFRALTGRPPEEDELAVIRELFQGQRSYFAADAKRAAEYLSVGDRTADQSLDPVRLAATSAVANTLLGHDHCITRR